MARIIVTTDTFLLRKDASVLLSPRIAIPDSPRYTGCCRGW